MFFAMSASAAAVRVGADLRVEIVIAEHVAEVERDASADHAAESIDAGRDVRLADGIERQPGLVRLHLGRRGRKAG